MANLEDRLTLAAWNAATEGSGNVKLVWGEYTGTGAWGSSYPNTLTFDGRPIWVHVRESSGGSSAIELEAFRGLTEPTLKNYTPATPAYCTWTDNSLS